MNPCASAKRARFRTEMPDPTSTGTPDGSRGVAHLVGRRLFAAGGAGHDHAVREEELGRPGGLGQRDIARDGVRSRASS